MHGSVRLSFEELCLLARKHAQRELSAAHLCDPYSQSLPRVTQVNPHHYQAFGQHNGIETLLALSNRFGARDGQDWHDHCNTPLCEARNYGGFVHGSV